MSKTLRDLRLSVRVDIKDDVPFWWSGSNEEYWALMYRGFWDCMFGRRSVSGDLDYGPGVNWGALWLMGIRTAPKAGAYTNGWDQACGWFYDDEAIERYCRDPWTRAVLGADKVDRRLAELQQMREAKLR